MGISYKQAWELVAEVNRTFDEPLVKAQSGGPTGGGAVITERGQELIRHYRTLERKALSATTPHLRTMQAAAARQHCLPPSSRAEPRDLFWLCRMTK